MSFLVYDLIFLGLFILFVIFFLYRNRKSLHKEKMLGLPVYLYKTKWGMKKIDGVGQKYPRFLNFLTSIMIFVGFLLMAGIIYVLLKSVYIYAVFPQITQIIKAPPITPLIPYFPQLFGVESLFPPFYFTYFILALAIVAIVHEFSHGIFMRLFKIKIKSTGFAFFGPFLGAFVEQDEKSFVKASNKAQMSVLSAGVFANIIFALIFLILLAGFFFLAFSPAGYQFNTYAYDIIPASGIILGNASGNYTQISSNNQTYLINNQVNLSNISYIVAYNDAPAIKVQMVGAISEINGVKIKNQEELSAFMRTTKPDEQIIIRTIGKNGEREYNITLTKNPDNESIGFLGVGFESGNQKGIVSAFMSIVNFKNPSTYYEPKFDGELVIFVYDLLWWVMLINFLVGLFNMLPAGPFDGGRFFYVAILSVTKSKKISQIAFKTVSWGIGMIFILLMILWFLGFR